MAAPQEIFRNLPHSLADDVVRFASVAKLPVEEFMILAIAEKVAAMQHHEWLVGKETIDRIDPCGDS